MKCRKGDDEVPQKDSRSCLLFGCALYEHSLNLYIQILLLLITYSGRALPFRRISPKSARITTALPPVRPNAQTTASRQILPSEARRSRRYRRLKSARPQGIHIREIAASVVREFSNWSLSIVTPCFEFLLLPQLVKSLENFACAGGSVSLLPSSVH